MKIRDVIIENNIELGDSFDIELGNIVIETGIVGFMHDGVIVEADEKTMTLLGISGALFESVKLAEVSLGGYHKKASMGKAMAQMNAVFAASPEEREKNLAVAKRREQGLARAKTRSDKILAAQKEKAQADALAQDRANLPELKAALAKLEREFDPAFEYSDDHSFWTRQRGIKDSIRGLQQRIARASQLDVTEGRMAEVDDLFQNLANGSMDIYDVMNNPQDAVEKYVSEKLQDMYDNVSIDNRLHPDDDFEQIIDIMAEQLADEYGTDEMQEAKYQGREVSLGKPMQGDVKKSKVYVRGPKGNVVKVNFGDKKMKIKKSNPKRRKSFRARHNCANPGPRWKARYWSCRAW